MLHPSHRSSFAVLESRKTVRLNPAVFTVLILLIFALLKFDAADELGCFI